MISWVRQFISPAGMSRLRAMSWRDRIGIGGLYALLIAFAYIMLFPFLYMIFTSVKTANDVFHYPPRLLPYSPETIEYQGQQVPLYRFKVNGQEQLMVLTGEKVPFGFFTTADQINPDQPRESSIIVQLPLEQATETGQEVALTNSAGASKTYPEYQMTVNDETVTYLLAYRGSLDEFISPDDPSITTYAVARTTPQVEQIDFQFENYSTILGLNLDKSFINTVVVTLGVVIGQLATSILGGYAFSRVRFRGRDSLFLAYLGSIMIPFVVLIVPMFRLMVALDWEGKLVSLIVPWIFTAYGTFMIRQFFLTIPKELEEAALLDGASRWRILWTIFVPLSTPAIATLAIFSFLYAWNSFLWPLVIIGEGNAANHVLTLSLIRLSNVADQQPNLALTGAAVAILPPVIVFILAQRYFIEGVATSGLKG
ncbi:MAG: carbohydrate ABC transporter permease [Anaerolineae bacterium]|nr:carbohydrate ABC transporter permease [Anaerolineae bacterium]